MPSPLAPSDTCRDGTPPSEDQARHRAVGRRADAIVAVLFLLLGCYVTFASIVRYGAFEGGQAGPGVLPFLIGVTLMATSALILLKLLRDAPLRDTLEMPPMSAALRVAALFTLIVIATAAIPFLGSLTALGLFVLVETLVLEKRGWNLSVATALLIPALLYVFFEALLGVPLPRGVIGLR